jgi:hypothetical protein
VLVFDKLWEDIAYICGETDLKTEIKKPKQNDGLFHWAFKAYRFFRFIIQSQL